MHQFIFEFRNLLKYPAVSENEQIRIEDFSIIVFDEAHRSADNHPYNGSFSGILCYLIFFS